MKKILSILLAAVMLITGVCTFASCGAVSAVSAIAQADQALENNPYCVTMTMDLRCDNPQINEALKNMDMEAPVTVNGDNMAMSMSMGITNIHIVVVDKVLYYDTNIKMKATLTDEQYKDFRENSAEMPIGSTNFETLTLETVDGKHVITCTGITAEGTGKLNKLLVDTLFFIDASAPLDNLSFKITIADGKYESIALSVDCAVTVGDETVTITLSMTAKYAYDDVKPITAPADAYRYEEADYDGFHGVIPRIPRLTT